MMTDDLVLIEKFKQKFLRQLQESPVSQEDIQAASPTKRYADGRQKLLGTHLGKATRLPPQPSAKALTRRSLDGGVSKLRQVFNGR